MYYYCRLLTAAFCPSLTHVGQYSYYSSSPSSSAVAAAGAGVGGGTGSTVGGGTGSTALSGQSAADQQSQQLAGIAGLAGGMAGGATFRIEGARPVGPKAIAAAATSSPTSGGKAGGGVGDGGVVGRGASARTVLFMDADSYNAHSADSQFERPAVLGALEKVSLRTIPSFLLLPPSSFLLPPSSFLFLYFYLCLPSTNRDALEEGPGGIH